MELLLLNFLYLEAADATFQDVLRVYLSLLTAMLFTNGEGDDL